ncbi:aminoglycoside phosphotransferase family protein [Streptomyces longisporoflavus]|uniref:Aminoglycoside phosphotransferase family protein n=1 Tax=Streptomyces longisporoflavus TaxID=28044 RepID=A0ABW7QS30_9ACTN
MIETPEDFAASTVRREGERGRAWLASLPELADELLDRWDCVPSAPVTHGQVGVIIPVLRGHDRTPAVLKISFPHPGNVHEPDAFTVWAGQGAVRLHERDDPRFAMLLEQAGPGSLADEQDADAALTAAGLLARRLAVPAPAELPRISARCEEWERELRDDDKELRSPLDSRVLDAAIATLRELGPDQPDTLIHGDLHVGNVLRGEREPWLAIDPKGYAGDPAYDAITLLHHRFDELLAAPDAKAAVLRRLAVFSDAAGIDRERARRWTQARAVTMAYWGRLHGDPQWRILAADGLAEALV